MRFSNIIMAYFVIGAVMFGGGAIQWNESGAAQFFVSNNSGDVSGADQAASNLGGIGGAIQSVIDMFAGPLIIVWNLIVGLLSFMHWPIIVLESNNAPPSVTILLGGAFVVAFYMSLIGLVTRSA
ncbi:MULTISPECIES: hypothetical protein [Halobacterium]|uniref:hypothetical protein n=1 Tax=Halobacterium TaxID=2239 RepID=UPI000ADBD008|nr:MULTISPECIES: hypothetical protein [Halobacterium]MCG1002859.1 hypothetical protein [Halobacterium noricense]